MTDKTIVYVSKDEFWPWYDITTNDTYSFGDDAKEIPSDLWHRYDRASKAYWEAKREILALVGVES